MANLFDLSDRVAVVMGATSGIGRTLAVGLAEHGATVIPTGRRSERLDEVCREIESKGGKTLRQTADVANCSSSDALRDYVMKHFSRVDILLNSGGLSFK